MTKNSPRLEAIHDLLRVKVARGNLEGSLKTPISPRNAGGTHLMLLLLSWNSWWTPARRLSRLSSRMMRMVVWQEAWRRRTARIERRVSLIPRQCLSSLMLLWLSLPPRYDDDSP